MQLLHAGRFAPYALYKIKTHHRHGEAIRFKELLEDSLRTVQEAMEIAEHFGAGRYIVVDAAPSCHGSRIVQQFRISNAA